MNVTPKKLENVDLTFIAPPSKSYTHRALIAGALAQGKSTIFRPLDAEDTHLTARALRKLGIVCEDQQGRMLISGCNGKIPVKTPATLDLDNSGTSLRLLSSLALLAQHPVTLTGSTRMQERPIGPLAEALSSLGGSVRFLRNPGFPPLEVSGRLAGGRVTIDGSVSSQFISSILMAAPYAESETGIVIPKPPASASYLDITLEVMAEFGAQVTREGYGRFLVTPGAGYKARRYTIEGDYSSASYYFAIAAVCGGRVRVKNLNPDSVQGDRRFLEALAAMGCRVEYGKDLVTVTRDGPLDGITFDMATSPDTVQTLAAVAATALGPTTITGISHLKFKESDRINGTADRLRSLGAGVAVTDDSMTVTPAPLRAGTIDPANDHRTAMSFAVLGMGTGGITITDAGCVNKSFPTFWESLAGVLR